jgi:AcrR family transcriptional regulator
MDIAVIASIALHRKNPVLLRRKAVNRGRSALSPRPPLDLDRIARAALALVDEGGLAALSMRKLGARLGVEAMTLYHYVRRKDDLLDLLLERAVLPAGAEAAEAGGDWRGRLSAYARRLRASLLAHPNLLPLVMSRPVRSKAAMTQFVGALLSLTEAGFDVGEAYCLLNGLGLMVLGLVAGEVNPPLPEGAPAGQAEAEADFRAQLAPMLGGEAAFAARHDRIFDLTLSAFIAGLAGRRTVDAPRG